MQSLTSIQLEAIQALSSGLSVTAAADALGIHRTTVHHWARTIPEFRNTLDAVKQARVDSTRDAMNSLAAPSIAILRNVIEDESASPSLRVRTALAVVKFATTPEKTSLPQTRRDDLDLFAVGYLAGYRAAHQPAESGDNLAFDQDHNQIDPEPALEDDIHRNSSFSSHVDEPDEAPHDTRYQTPRNALCPCGSGNKYKRCCGKNAPPVLTRAA